MCMTVLGLVGAAVSAMGSIMQANAQASAMEAQAAQYEAQAALQRRQAYAERMAGQREAAKKRLEVDQMTARQRVAYGTAGVTIDGSPTDVALDTQREGMLDVGAIQWGAEVKSGNFHYSAAISEMNAQSARDAAGTARSIGPVNALGSFLGGVTRMASSGGSFGGTSLGGGFFGA